MVTPSLAEQAERHRDARCEHRHEEGPRAQRELQPARDAVARGAAAGHARAEQHHGAAEEGGGVARRLAGAEPPRPEPRDALGAAIARQPAGDDGTDEAVSYTHLRAHETPE